MSDIVEQLRTKCFWCRLCVPCQDMLVAAADEIDQLRASAKCAREILEAECQPMACGHAKKWLAYRKPVCGYADRYCVLCELARLRPLAAPVWPDDSTEGGDE